MKSRFGARGAFSAQGSPYITYALCAQEADEALAALLNLICELRAAQPEATIVWRTLPVVENQGTCWQARARFTLEP